MSATGGLKKAWRDSACLMMVTGPFRYNGQNAATRLTSAGSFLGPRSAPPICLEAKEEEEEEEGTKGNMEFLFVQRNRNAGFMPNMYVFPGGVIDKADYSPTWVDLFRESSGPNRQPFAALLSKRNLGQLRLPLYTDIPSTSPIAGEVAFRICAIREAFEEAGVLLARDKEDVPSKMDFLPGSFSPAVKVLPKGIWEEWRKRVHDNAEEFATMCRELHCVPDIWSLVEWSEWLTPRNMGRRYDTVFYLCCCETTPPISPDGTEVVDTQWMSPSEAVGKFMSREIVLAPPQFAELGTILRLDTASCLHSYGLHGNLNGKTYRKVGMRIKTKDNIILSITNGDDLYPTEASYWLTDKAPAIHHPCHPALKDRVSLHIRHHKHYEYECPTLTAEELRQLTTNACRMEILSPTELKFVDNVISKRVDDHMERYAAAHEHCKSKL